MSEIDRWPDAQSYVDHGNWVAMCTKCMYGEIWHDALVAAGNSVMQIWTMKFCNGSCIGTSATEFSMRSCILLSHGGKRKGKMWREEEYQTDAVSKHHQRFKGRNSGSMTLQLQQQTRIHRWASLLLLLLIVTGWDFSFTDCIRHCQQTKAFSQTSSAKFIVNRELIDATIRGWQWALLIAFLYNQVLLFHRMDCHCSIQFSTVVAFQNSA